MLAARSRGLGTVLSTLHLAFEQEAADVLGIPYEQVMQVGLIPVAYTPSNQLQARRTQAIGIGSALGSVVRWRKEDRIR
jgi:hypothetical protein